MKTLLALLAIMAAAQGDQSQSMLIETKMPSQAPVRADVKARPVDIMFVCQHGYAKSLVAALHFERLARERGLAVRVVARGLTPAQSVPPALAVNLKRDGFDVADYRPAPVSAADLKNAEHIIGLSITPPQGKHAMTEAWDDLPALSEDYAKARDVILAHLQPLLDRVAEEMRPRR